MSKLEGVLEILHLVQPPHSLMRPSEGLTASQWHNSDKVPGAQTPNPVLVVVRACPRPSHSSALLRLMLLIVSIFHICSVKINIINFFGVFYFFFSNEKLLKADCVILNYNGLKTMVPVNNYHCNDKCKKNSNEKRSHVSSADYMSGAVLSILYTWSHLGTLIL